ncbi:MAG: SUMF1/EgtB/PvdO family nonheme iron enzyme [Pirellulaceae bacterium]|nr:SUMF1/EgtB/PvdO family nonheme iron enzyme [Pirellulaceae bacterium]
MTLTRRDMDAFCKWLSQRDGVTYRLPLELEWETSWRAGGDQQFGQTKQFGELADYGWIQMSRVDGASPVRPVAQKLANPFGLYDMIGNVTERVQREASLSAFNRGFLSRGTTTYRGGSWYSGNGPFHISHTKESYQDLGFRVLREFPDHPPTITWLATPIEQAKLILEYGGTLTLRTRDQDLEIPKGGTLPEEPFEITRVSFVESAREFDAPLIDAITSLPTLSWLNFASCPLLKDEVVEKVAAYTETLPAFETWAITWNPLLTERSATAVAKVSGLQEIQLGGRSLNVTAQLLATFPCLPNLQILILGDPPVSGAKLQCLSRATKLTHLYYFGLTESDALMETIHKAGNPLQVLVVNGSDLTDAGMAHVPTTVNWLQLPGTRITDAGIRGWAAQQPAMVHLNLAHTAISDAGLGELRQLKRLDYLNVTGTRATPEGIAALKKVFPDCKVDSDHAVPAAAPATQQ